MSSSAISAAGITPDELKPYCPDDMMNMNVRLVLFGLSARARFDQPDAINSSRQNNSLSGAVFIAASVGGPRRSWTK